MELARRGAAARKRGTHAPILVYIRSSRTMLTRHRQHARDGRRRRVRRQRMRFQWAPARTAGAAAATCTRWGRRDVGGASGQHEQKRKQKRRCHGRTRCARTRPLPRRVVGVTETTPRGIACHCLQPKLPPPESRAHARVRTARPRAGFNGRYPCEYAAAAVENNHQQVKSIALAMLCMRTRGR